MLLFLINEIPCFVHLKKIKYYFLNLKKKCWRRKTLFFQSAFIFVCLAGLPNLNHVKSSEYKNTRIEIHTIF